MNARQLRAVDLVAAGGTDAEAADELEVDRSTVWRWRTESPPFEAALNRRRKEYWDASVDRWRSLLPRALDVLADEMESGKDRGRVALELLRLAGFEQIARKGQTLGSYGVGLTDADLIVDASHG